VNPPSPSGAIDIAIDDRHSGASIDVAHLGGLLAAVLADQGVLPPAEVGLTFVDTDEMAELNASHMGGSGPTDVLAFPIDGAERPPVGQPAMIGDIVVCPSVAAQAPQPLADELALLVVHGALHLLGHDHAEPDETVIMQGLERSLLDRYHRTS
jgi:probable rRNA maturation factor